MNDERKIEAIEKLERREDDRNSLLMMSSMVASGIAASRASEKMVDEGIAAKSIRIARHILDQIDEDIQKSRTKIHREETEEIPF